MVDGEDLKQQFQENRAEDEKKNEVEVAGGRDSSRFQRRWHQSIYFSLRHWTRSDQPTKEATIQRKRMRRRSTFWEAKRARGTTGEEEYQKMLREVGCVFASRRRGKQKTTS